MTNVKIDKMTFEYRKNNEGRSYPNIIFPRAWPMRNGNFPKEHPCSDDKNAKKKVGDEWIDVSGDNPESESMIGKFRSRGYWASAFPEGDGIVFEALQGQDDNRIIVDIMECFDVYVVFKEF